MSIRSILLAGTVAGLALSATMPVFAASGSAQSQIDALRKQMQTEIDALKQEVATLKGQQQTTQAKTEVTEQKVDTAVAAVAKVTPPKGKKGIQIGAVTVTPGGFIEAAGLYRDKNMTSDVDTKFNSIPFGNSSNSHVDENRFSARQSRLSLLATSDVDSTTHLGAYYEMDFLGAAGTANSNQSNSYNLRIRNIYGTVDWDDLGLHLLAGQNWSLATMNTNGITPRNENVPLTIDAQYVVGFDWTRTPQFRIAKDFADKTFWLAVSVENPQTTVTGTAPSGAGALVSNLGGSLFDSNTAYSIDAAPDIIVKAAWEPGFGHYEVYGIASFERDRVNFNNRTNVAGGVGAGMMLPVIPHYLDFQVSGLVGQGVGRYGTSQLPDATFGADGSIHPLTTYSLLAGLIGHPSPALDIYGYGGIEHADRWYQSVNGTNYGYGNPAYSNTGCQGNDHIEGNSSLSCTANTRDVMEATAGFWWKFYQGDFGSARWGAQYEYIARNVWGGVGGGGTADNNILMTSFRFYPF
jgi:hypothetical protein